MLILRSRSMSATDINFALAVEGYDQYDVRQSLSVLIQKQLVDKRTAVPDRYYLTILGAAMTDFIIRHASESASG